MPRFSLYALVVLVFSLATAGLAQDGAPPEEEAAAGSGIYTAEQAERGKQAFYKSCASCHGIRLNGGMGPALTGDSFISSWGSDTVQELFDFIKANMPLGVPGTLSDETYVDIVAFILSNNGHPAGASALTVDSEALDDTTVNPDAE